jgi:hypothetical protein
MEEAKIDEQNEVSDGEIIDDDDMKNEDNSLEIKVRKCNTLKKNFRTHKNYSDEDREEEENVQRKGK